MNILRRFLEWPMNKAQIFPVRSFKYRGMEVNLNTLVPDCNDGKKYNFDWPDCSASGDVWSMKFRYEAWIPGPKGRLSKILNILNNECINPYTKVKGTHTRLRDGHLYYHDKGKFKFSFYGGYMMLLTMESYAIIKGRGSRPPRKLNSIMSFNCLFDWATDYIKEKILMSENNSVRFLLEDEQK